MSFFELYFGNEVQVLTIHLDMDLMWNNYWFILIWLDLFVIACPSALSSHVSSVQLFSLYLVPQFWVRLCGITALYIYPWLLACATFFHFSLHSMLILFIFWHFSKTLIILCRIDQLVVNEIFRSLSDYCSHFYIYPSDPHDNYNNNKKKHL